MKVLPLDWIRLWPNGGAGLSYFNHSVANIYLKMVMTEGHGTAVPNSWVLTDC